MSFDYGKWAFNNKKLVYFIITFLMIGGVVSYFKISKLEDPELKVKQALVVTVYPGASAHEVELEVTDVLEKSINEIPDIYNIESSSTNDMSLITVELKPTVKPEDVEQKWDLLRRKVANSQVNMPEGAYQSVIKDDFGDVYGMFYALTGDGLTDHQLSDYAELIKREINDIEGVTRVEIYGKRQECIYISLLEDKMANIGVMPAEIFQTLRGQNKTVYSGYFNNGTNRIRVTVNDRFKHVDDIGNMIISGHSDDKLRIRDIAKVTKGYEEPTRNEMTYNGERALGISIACSSSFDIIKVGKKVNAKIEELKSRLPVGVECKKVFYQPERVSNAINTFMVNLVESVAVVILVLIFTMGLKSGIIIGISLITIVFGSILVLGGIDGTLQRVSLGAFIVAMGMLVDNAIVIVDGILVDMKNGKPRMEALTSIGNKTSMSLLGATIIAILAFLPIAVSPDSTGMYVRDLFVVIAVSLMLSWILALTHVPLMADQWLGKKENKKEDEKALYEGKSYTILEKTLKLALANRTITVVITLLLFIISAFGYKFLKQGFFPDMDYDQLYMEYKLPEGTNYTQVEQDLREIREYLKTRDEITNITASVGGTPSRYNLVRSIATPSLSYGELIIDFKSPELLVDNLDEIQSEISKRYPEAYVKFKRYNLMYKKYPIEAVFLGPDPEVLHSLSNQAMEKLSKSEYVYLITTDWEPKVPVLKIDYNQPTAREAGLSRSDIAMSMLAYNGGIPMAKFYDGIHPENIYIKCTDANGNDISDLSNANVFGIMPNIGSIANKKYVTKLMSGELDKNEIIETLTKSTPLKQVTKSIDIEWEDPVVQRYNGQRSQRIQCSPRPGFATENARKNIEPVFESIKLPEGYSLCWEGEHKASKQSMKYLFDGFPIAIVIMIVILIMLFHDYKKPTIIFCCIPLVVIGVIPAMLISGKAFGFVAVVGVLGLIGMIIKNGIVLMDEINLEIENGIEPYKALISSSKSRLRAVSMAAGTTILGMMPLLTDSLFGSLAVTIIGGLTVGTIITLIFIPVLYSLFFGIKIENNK